MLIYGSSARSTGVRDRPGFTYNIQRGLPREDSIVHPEESHADGTPHTEGEALPGRGRD